MSELIIRQNAGEQLRWQLLTTVSALAICGLLCTVDAAKADDADHPTVWIELGGQLERVQSDMDPFLPPFLHTSPRPGFEEQTSAEIQHQPRYAVGGEAKLLFAPEGSDWSVLASVRYGRSNGSKHVHQQTTQHKLTGLVAPGQPFYANLTAFGDTATAHRQSYAILDFMAGKDVGIGFGQNGKASFDFGVRVAQFGSSSTTTLHELPDPYIHRVPQPPNPFLPDLLKYRTYTHHHVFYALNSITRSFSGVGPSLSFNGSSPVLGNEDELEVAFDWGINAAMLFGRQKVSGQHKTHGGYYTNKYASGYRPKTSYPSIPKPVSRSRRVAVPNVGGFAGLTFRHANAKVSFGYRADFFFGAMDGGIDTRNTSTVGFHGPFATISIGLGG
jgi:hypothetical protein